MRWDEGDCNDRFVKAGQEAAKECDRSVCRPLDQFYGERTPSCSQPCFKASCDWSHSMCSVQREHLSSCPLFDSAVLLSIRSEFNRSLLFVQGGSAR